MYNKYSINENGAFVCTTFFSGFVESKEISETKYLKTKLIEMANMFIENQQSIGFDDLEIMESLDAIFGQKALEYLGFEEFMKPYYKEDKEDY